MYINKYLSAYINRTLTLVGPSRGTKYSQSHPTYDDDDGYLKFVCSAYDIANFISM
jgi:hypothetical protein